jgi:hypothetical protein
MRERRTNLTKRARFDALRAGLVARLRRVCEGMPPRELERLTAAMTRLKLKYEPLTGLPERDADDRGSMDV